MAGHATLPVWLLNSKASITKSKEWSNFINELNDAIDQQLKESHVGSFYELSEAERQMFIQRAQQAIKGGHSYGKLYEHVSNVLDRDLNQSVNRLQLEGASKDTKSNLILDGALDGSVGLLKKWPDLRNKLHVFLNQPLPNNLRPVAWRLFLENEKIRNKYQQNFDSNPRSTVSVSDREIAAQSERTLADESILNENLSSAGSRYAMATALSFYHKVHGEKTPLHAAYYRLFLPFIVVVSPYIPRKETPGADIVALLVEEYYTFVESLPRFIHSSFANVPDDGLNIFSNRVLNHLKKMNSDMASPGGSSRTEILNSLSASSLKGLLLPLLQNMFVGYTSKDVLLYIWDQYIIGLDSAGFNDDFLPIVTAVFVKLVVDRLNAKKAILESPETLSVEGKRLIVTQFQYEIERHFHSELQSRLMQTSRAALPVLDPTQFESRWHEWFESEIMNHVKPEARRASRIERESSRRQPAAVETVRDYSPKPRPITQLTARSIQPSRAAVPMPAEDDRLEQERRRREESERMAAEEIARLRRELDEIRRQKQVQSVVARPPTRPTRPSSPISIFLIAPPPTVNRSHSPPQQYQLPPPPAPVEYRPRLVEISTQTRTPVQTPKPVARARDPTPVSVPKEPTPRPPTKRETPQKINPNQQTTIDLLRKIAGGLNRVAQGEGYPREQLNDATKKALATHRSDLKKAELEVFGRELKKGEFQQLPKQTQADKTKELTDILQKQYIERKKKSGKRK